MTRQDLYDWLIASGVSDPAALLLGDRHIAGRWEVVSEQLPNGHICRVGRVGIHVLGEGDTWEAAQAAAKVRLRCE